VDSERFLSIVRREAGLDRPAAERVAVATLEILAERLMPGQVRALAGLLPGELGRHLVPRRPRERFDADDFLRRAANRAETELAAAASFVPAVFVAVSRATTAVQFDTMAAELPKDFDPLLAGARRPDADVLPVEEFLGRVADRAGTDFDAAQAASEAVLETLAERIAGGQVNDLRKELPPELHPALQRGLEHSGGEARRMSLDEFLALVAEREGAPGADPREHARAVVVTLRDAVTPKAFRDVESELPREYAVLTAP
jgi:uncharacterized protein (DUF2267 family)